MIKNSIAFIWVGWKKLAERLNLITASVIFALIYLIVIGVYAILAFPARWLAAKKHQPSSWRKKKYQVPTQEKLERQF